MIELPFRVEPLGQETISSWLMRVRRRYRMPLPEILAAVGAQTRRANDDPDFVFNRDTIAPLAQAMGVTTASIEQLIVKCDDIPNSHRVAQRYRFFYCPECWLGALNTSGPFIHQRWIDRRVGVCPLHPVALTCEPRNIFFAGKEELAALLPNIARRCRRAAGLFHPQLGPYKRWGQRSCEDKSMSEIYLDGRGLPPRYAWQLGYVGYLAGPRQIGRQLLPVARRFFLLPRVPVRDRELRGIFSTSLPPIYRRLPSELVLVERDTHWRTAFLTRPAMRFSDARVFASNHDTPVKVLPELTVATFGEALSVALSNQAKYSGGSGQTSAIERWQLYQDAIRALNLGALVDLKIGPNELS